MPDPKFKQVGFLVQLDKDDLIKFEQAFNLLKENHPEECDRILAEVRAKLILNFDRTLFDQFLKPERRTYGDGPTDTPWTEHPQFGRVEGSGG